MHQFKCLLNMDPGRGPSPHCFLTKMMTQEKENYETPFPEHNLRMSSTNISSRSESPTKRLHVLFTSHGVLNDITLVYDAK